MKVVDVVHSCILHQLFKSAIEEGIQNTGVVPPPTPVAEETPLVFQSSKPVVDTKFRTNKGLSYLTSSYVLSTTRGKANTCYDYLSVITECYSPGSTIPYWMLNAKSK